MANPHFCYAVSFLASLVVYSLDWSSMYPRLSWGLICFLVSTSALHAIVGLRLHRSWHRGFRHVSSDPGKRAVAITLFIYLLWGLDFAHAGGVPLFKLLLNQPYDYRTFGFPSVHVFTVTFSSFYTVYLFHVYLSSGRKLILLLFIINLAAGVLIYSRAMIFFNLTSCLFVFLAVTPRLQKRLVYTLPAALLVLLYCFGVLGTLRVSRESSQGYNNQLFLRTGNATQRFKALPIPKEYFWAYVYITSPLANLQTNIDRYPAADFSASRFFEMVNNEVLMDFISKRINALNNKERKAEYTIGGPFNVSTIYSRSFSYMNWFGMATMAVIVLLLPWLYGKMLPVHSRFFVTGFAILCTMFLFMAYDNTIRFTGLCFQLVYPVGIHLLTRSFPAVGKWV